MVISQSSGENTATPVTTSTSFKATRKKDISGGGNNEVSATACSNCGTTTTPLWRRAPNGDTICNACGLYLKARNVLRPPSMKRNVKKQQQQQQQQQLPHVCSGSAVVVSAADAPNGTCPGGGQCNGTGGSPSCEGCPAFNQHQVNRHALICANCRTTTTPLWRRDEAGNTICNACGLYYKLHNVHRPVSMKRSVIKRRKRIIVSDTGEIKEGEEDEDEDELDSSSADDTPVNDHLDDDDDDDEEKVKAAEKKRKRKVVNHRKRPAPATATTTAATASSSGGSGTSTAMNPAVPPIEDYIIPKRTSFASQQRHQDVIPVTPSQRMPPPPRTPPLNPTFHHHHPRALPALSDIHHHRPSLPPTSQRFDPLFDYRSNTTATNTTATTTATTTTAATPSSTLKAPPTSHMALPPIVATPPPPRSIPLNNPYEELSDFDEAMTKLERLRRRVPPEQSKVLSRLTSSLEEIVQQAEYILLNTQQQQQLQSPQQHELSPHHHHRNHGISQQHSNHRL